MLVAWTALKISVGGPGPSWLKRIEEHGCFDNVSISKAGARFANWGGRSYTALGAYNGGLGSLWSLCWRSETALVTCVGSLGPLLDSMLAVLGRFWDL